MEVGRAVGFFLFIIAVCFLLEPTGTARQFAEVIRIIRGAF